MNNDANYVLSVNETAFVAKTNTSPLEKMKPIIIGIIIVLIAGSFVFEENLFSELSLISKVILLGLLITVLRIKTTEKQPSQLDIYFYDDKMVMYRKCIYRTKKVSRKEYYTIKYDDITKSEIRPIVDKVSFYCTYDGLFYNYNSDGTVNTVPSYNKRVKNGICFFYYDFDKNRDFAKEIEEHSPLKVIIEDK